MPAHVEETPRRLAAIDSVSAWVSRWWTRGAVAVLVAVLTWPRVLPTTTGGLDVSWKIALQLAAPTHKAFGPELVFTYGPLGFLLSPHVFYAKPGVLALLTLGTVWLVFATSLVVVLARSFSLPVAGLLSFGVLVLVAVVAPDSLSTVLNLTVLLLITEALVRGTHRWSWRGAFTLGLVPAVALLSKADGGLSVLSMVLIGSTAGGWLQRGRRGGFENAAAAAGGFLVGLPIAWLLSRQALGDLPDWLAGTSQIVTGYSSAMGLESARWEYAAALLLVAVLVTFLWTTSAISRPTRVALTVLLAAGLYPLFRSAFTRHPGRGVSFFVAFVVIPFAFVTLWSRRDTLLLVLAGTLVVLAVSELTLADAIDVESHLTNLENTVELVASSERRSEWIDEQRAALAEKYAIPRRMRAVVGGASVHVVPWETGVLFAYPELHWDPLPVFQDYSAYTEDLDDRNSDALTASGRPAFLFREPHDAIDGRFPRFDPPRQNLELLCHYRVVDTADGWELLRARRDRCGSLVEGPGRQARLGQTVSAPRSRGDLVLARFSGIGDSLVDRLETTLLRGPEFFIGPGGGDDSLWKFLPGTQGSWHVLTGPACAERALASTGPPLPRFVLSDHRGPATGDDGYTVQFARVRFVCPKS